MPYEIDEAYRRAGIPRDRPHQHALEALLSAEEALEHAENEIDRARHLFMRADVDAISQYPLVTAAGPALGSVRTRAHLEQISALRTFTRSIREALGETRSLVRRATDDVREDIYWV